VTRTMSVLRMATDGSTSLTPFKVITVQSTGGDVRTADIPTFDSQLNAVIPDGQGGVLVSWWIPGHTPANPNPSYYITHVLSGGGTNDFTFPAFNGPAIQMVLGDHDQSVYAGDGAHVIHFNLADGSLIWTYTPTSNTSSTNILISTAGGGIAINDSQLGVIQLSSTGAASAPVSSIQGAIPLKLGLSSFCSPQSTPQCGLWAANSGGQTAFSASLFLAPAPSSWIAPDSDQTHNRSAVPVPDKLTLSLGAKQVYNGGPLILNGRTVASVFYGYLRLGTYTVVDKNGNAIKNAKMTAAEKIDNVTSNPPNPVSFNANTPVPVDANGQFLDDLVFGFSNAAPAPGQFIKERQTATIATKAQSYPKIRVNCLDKEYNDVTVTDVTGNPNATCQ
jgi:hypothetical protein